MEDEEFPPICNHTYKEMLTTQTVWGICTKCTDTTTLSCEKVNQFSEELLNNKIEKLEDENYLLKEKLDNLTETYYELMGKIDSLVNNA